MTDQQTEILDIPAGFTEMKPYGPYDGMAGPWYHMQRGDRCVVAMRMQDKHRNAGAIVHGGMLMLLADNAMTRASVMARPADAFVVTTSMNSEIMAPARPGDWVEAEVEIMRAGRRVIFLNCVVRKDGPEGQMLMHSSATFQVVTGNFGGKKTE